MNKLILSLLLLPVLAGAAELSSTAQQEISHLISHLQSSGCQLNRNGQWYTSREAADHLSQKYRYLLKKGLVSSSEEFIARAASESSMSGKPYQVQCGSSAPVQSGSWLKAELDRYREGASSATDKSFNANAGKPARP